MPEALPPSSQESNYPQLPPGASWPGSAYRTPEPTKSKGGLSPFKIVLAGGALLAAIFGFLFVTNPGLFGINTGPVTLTYWGVVDSEEILKPLFEEYQTAHPGVTIKYERRSLTQYRETVQTRLAEGSGPDIFQIHNTWLPIVGGDLAEVSGYSAGEMEATFYPTVKADLSRDGRYYGVPLQFDGLALLYNETLFQAAGVVAPPQTWTEIRSTYAPRLTTYNPDGSVNVSGMAMGTSTNVTYFSDILGLILLQNGVKMVDSGQVRFHEDLASDGRNKGADALNFYTLFAKRDFSDRGAVWSDKLASSVDAFVAGKAAMILVPAARIPDILSRVGQAGSGLTVKAAPAPQPIAGGKGVYWASYWAEAVAKNSPVKGAAWDLIKFLSSKESLRKLYTEEARVRGVSSVPSRVDLANEYSSQPYLGAYLAGAQEARSWYLASGTGDGSLNDPIIVVFSEVVTTVYRASATAEAALKTAAPGVETVLARYGLATPSKK